MPTYQNKIAIIIRADLLEWQKLNVENDQQIRRVFMRAKERGLSIGIYTKPLFATKGEDRWLEASSLIFTHLQVETDPCGCGNGA